jgi:hypothetical protein
MTAEQKQAKKNLEKTRCVIQRNTLSKNYITVVNPLYGSSNWAKGVRPQRVLSVRA